MTIATGNRFRTLASLIEACGILPPFTPAQQKALKTLSGHLDAINSEVNKTLYLVEMRHNSPQLFDISTIASPQLVDSYIATDLFPKQVLPSVGLPPCLVPFYTVEFDYLRDKFEVGGLFLCCRQSSTELARDLEEIVYYLSNLFSLPIRDRLQWEELLVILRQLSMPDHIGIMSGRGNVIKFDIRANPTTLLQIAESDQPKGIQLRKDANDLKLVSQFIAQHARDISIRLSLDYSPFTGRCLPRLSIELFEKKKPDSLAQPVNELISELRLPAEEILLHKKLTLAIKTMNTPKGGPSGESSLKTAYSHAKLSTTGHGWELKSYIYFWLE